MNATPEAVQGLVRSFMAKPFKEMVQIGRAMAQTGITYADIAPHVSLDDILLIAARSRIEWDAGLRYAGLEFVERTMQGSTGSAGGFTLKQDLADSVWDKARQTDGPLKRCTVRYTKERMFSVPGFNESSRAAGSRWGGSLGTWGLPETVLPASSQPQTSLVDFNIKRLLVYTSPISRDLLADTDRVKPMLSYAAQSEIRYSIELAMLVGVLGGPAGVTRPSLTGSDGSAAGRGVVQVAKGATGPGAISSLNIDNMWAALYGPCKRNAIWVANDDTVAALDNVATSFNWPETIYLPDGWDDGNGNKYALLKGRPLIPVEGAPAIGTPGDLIVADWTQYWLVINKPKPGSSSLSFDVTIPVDDGHEGVVALPDNVVEQRMSDQILFSTDSVSFLWKLRADGGPVWTTTMTNLNGAAVGWAVILAQR